MAMVCSVNVSGSNSASCGSYPNCEPTCCDNAYSGCSGTTTGCPGKTQAQCTDNTACCVWGGVAPQSCMNVTCVGMAEGDCGRCAGCTKTGSCSKKACSSQTDPTICAGCNDCAGTITIDTGVATLPWDVKAKVVRFPTAIGLRFNTSYRLLLYN